MNFKPTYKYDVGSSNYDTSSKGRIPSWTDRILFVPRPEVRLLAYNSEDSITTSDHRPVYASFCIDLQLTEEQLQAHHVGTATEIVPIEHHKVPEFTSESQVCTIM